MDTLLNHLLDRFVQPAGPANGTTQRPRARREDIAMGVIRSFVRGADANRFATIRGRDDLWELLTKIIQGSVARHVCRKLSLQRRSQAGIGTNHDEEHRDLFDILLNEGLFLEVVGLFRADMARLFALLEGEDLREITLLRLEGHTKDDIAKQLGWSPRSIERKLELIRKKWGREIGQ